MSQPKSYRGNSRWVICQASDGAGHLCYKPVRTTGTGMIASKPSLLYECTAGHRFALTDARRQRGPATFGRTGELDPVSGESPNSPIAAFSSGESRNSPDPPPSGFDPRYTDFRKVTHLSTERPVFR